MDVNDMTRDELEHEAIQAQMKIISAQITANFEVIGVQLENILKEARETNGRVKDLEKDTKILSFFMNHKTILALTMAGLYAVYNLDLNEIFKIIKSLL